MFSLLQRLPRHSANNIIGKRQNSFLDPLGPHHLVTAVKVQRNQFYVQSTADHHFFDHPLMLAALWSSRRRHWLHTSLHKVFNNRDSLPVALRIIFQSRQDIAIYQSMHSNSLRGCEIMPPIRFGYQR